MPECDGFSLMDKMQELRYIMPVIVVTGHSRADSRDQVMNRGAVGFLQKPFNERSLLALIEAQMDDGNQMSRRQTQNNSHKNQIKTATQIKNIT